MKRIVQIIYLGLGFLFLGIGIIGIILPILPTTPFLLLAAFLFAKGSTRFHTWFINGNLYQKHVGKWLETKSMTSSEKKKILLFVTLLFGLGIFVAPIWHAKVLLIVILAIHYYIFIVRLKTIDKT